MKTAKRITKGERNRYGASFAWSDHQDVGACATRGDAVVLVGAGVRGVELVSCGTGVSVLELSKVDPPLQVDRLRLEPALYVRAQRFGIDAVVHLIDDAVEHGRELRRRDRGEGRDVTARHLVGQADVQLADLLPAEVRVGLVEDRLDPEILDRRQDQRLAPARLDTLPAGIEKREQVPRGLRIRAAARDAGHRAPP